MYCHVKDCSVEELGLAGMEPVDMASFIAFFLRVLNNYLNVNQPLWKNFKICRYAKRNKVTKKIPPLRDIMKVTIFFFFFF